MKKIIVIFLPAEVFLTDFNKRDKYSCGVYFTNRHIFLPTSSNCAQVQNLNIEVKESIFASVYLYTFDLKDQRAGEKTVYMTVIKPRVESQTAGTRYALIATACYLIRQEIRDSDNIGRLLFKVAAPKL